MYQSKRNLRVDLRDVRAYADRLEADVRELRGKVELAETRANLEQAAGIGLERALITLGVNTRVPNYADKFLREKIAPAEILEERAKEVAKRIKPAKPKKVKPTHEVFIVLKDQTVLEYETVTPGHFDERWASFRAVDGSQLQFARSEIQSLEVKPL